MTKPLQTPSLAQLRQNEARAIFSDSLDDWTITAFNVWTQHVDGEAIIYRPSQAHWSYNGVRYSGRPQHLKEFIQSRKETVHDW